jgi:hypothetical protein
MFSVSCPSFLPFLKYNFQNEVFYTIPKQKHFIKNIETLSWLCRFH